MTERKGWFVIDGLQAGDRTLAQQMLGLEAALAASIGKRVLDLGCAEGLIALEFLRAGAAHVTGIECNPATAAVARRLFQPHGSRCRIIEGNLNTEPMPAGPWPVVLALAILHKLEYPDAVVAKIAALDPEMVVVRLPKGSEGAFITKHYRKRADLNKSFLARRFDLLRTCAGPNDELVQYWVR